MAAEINPTMNALLAAAAEPMPEVPLVILTSEGVILIYGRDARAVLAGEALQDQLDVTVLIAPPAAGTPVVARPFPVAQGSIRAVKGHLGAFEIIVDRFALLAPSSDAAPSGLPQDGAVSHCDVILDLSGGAPVFTAADLRAGYVRADPDDLVGMQSATATARELIGNVQKPRYISLTRHMCAHTRSKRNFCPRCLE